MGTLCCLLACGGLASLLVHGPELLAGLIYGSTKHIPARVHYLDSLLKPANFKRRRWLGATRFAEPSSYHAEGEKIKVLPEGSRASYLAEGYLVLRGLIPPETVLALREELFQNYSFDLEKNSHFESDALLDFLAFSPFGQVAAELLGTESVHLLRSVLHFRPTSLAFKRVGNFHFDWLECDHDLPAVAAGFLDSDALAETAPIKFNLALYDDMPALWLLNRSTLGALVNVNMTDASFGDQSPDAKGQQRLPAGPEGLPFWVSQEAADAVAVRPRLRLGDVVVHSPALAHRSPDAPLGELIGFLSPSYAAPASQCLGRYASNRECDWEAEQRRQERNADAEGSHEAEKPGSARQETLLGDVPGCFPQVYPKSPARKTEFLIELRRNFATGPFGRLLSSSLTRWLFLVPSPEDTASGGRADSGESEQGLPCSHEVVLSGGSSNCQAGADRRASEARDRPGHTDEL
ncbi:unnamed protein product [Polarella glacialis]|uniref:Uncharacterized protein n=1 Tax=Polarella glacialis TaxID=89957 RepID=A0A813FJW0_POLGL|nr:unnamed protein product [Polarella glacialis]